MSSRESKEDVSVDKKKRRIVKVEKSTPDAVLPSTASTGSPQRPKASTVPSASGSNAADSKQIGRVLFSYEENEVLERDALEDLERHKAVCTELRRVMLRIKELKDSGQDDISDEIDRLRVHGTLQFVSLKKLNRIGHFRCKKVREVTNDAKQKIDQHHLRLQNLLYEVMHLQKEITKCLQFKSKDEEISLVSVDDFFASAPCEISKPDLTSVDNHQLTLARLDFELEQRKRLSEKLKEMQQQKDLIMSEIRAQKEYLDSLQPKLKSIIQVTKPVQEHLSLPFDEIREQHQTASHLPEPLYILYMQVKAYGESCDKFLTANIQGDVNAVGTLEDNIMDFDEESDSEDEQDKANGKRHRRNTIDSQFARTQERITRKHPLSICVRITCKDKSVLSLTFYYLMTLKIVTVEVKLTPGPDTQSTTISGSDLLNPDSILNCIYPDDFGDHSPNPATAFILQRGGMEEFSSYVSQIGRPYLWAQWLCGLQFLVESRSLQKSLTPMHTGQMEQTVRRLRRRIRSRLALQKQLEALERGTVPISSSFIRQFPAKIVSRLVQWKRTTYEDILTYPYMQRMIGCDLASPSRLFFTGLVERGSAALTFHVVVAPDYPLSSPVFALSLRWKDERTALSDEGIREMEKEVNVYAKDLVDPRSMDQLLTIQVQNLLMCFDIYLETEMDSRSAIEGPNEFAKEKMCPRIFRGPSRSKPYKYNFQLGFFTHR